MHSVRPSISLSRGLAPVMPPKTVSVLPPSETVAQSHNRSENLAKVIKKEMMKKEKKNRPQLAASIAARG